MLKVFLLKGVLSTCELFSHNVGFSFCLPSKTVSTCNQVLNYRPRNSFVVCSRFKIFVVYWTPQKVLRLIPITHTAWKVSVFGVFQVPIFRIRTECGPEKPQIRTLFHTVSIPPCLLRNLYDREFLYVYLHVLAMLQKMIWRPLFS